ncbi:hypothetical protein BUMB_00611c [Candidatus Paraburkholderia calva]|nr:hypothetical protein BUMB_00611c [Candidatus Paraburkholderia calva]
MLLDTDSGASTLCIHHALFDGWSLKLLLDEITAVYEGRDLEARDIDWFDFNAWTHRIRDSQPYAQARDYWTRKLAGVTLRFDLPHDASAPKPDANRVISMQLTPAQADPLRRIGLRTTPRSRRCCSRCICYGSGA